MRILGVLGTSALLVSVPPPDPARAEHAGLWESPRGVRAVLTRQGNEYELRADSAPVLFQLFGETVRPGTLLLRMHMSGNEFFGEAFSYGPRCSLSYSVHGIRRGETLEWSGYAPRQTMPGTCRVARTAFTTNSVRLVWAPAPPARPPARPPLPVAQKPSASRQADSEPFDFAGLAILGGFFICSVLVTLYLRVLFLRRLRNNQLVPRALAPAVREPRSPFSSSLPSSSGKLLGSRTELVKADAAFVAAHTEWLRQRVHQTDTAADLVDARLLFAEKLAALATVPALMNTSNPHATPASFSLTLAEIEEMVGGMPEVTPELRGALLRLLQARLKEKLG